jgi:DNA polymerase-3 subunit alpha
MKYYTFNCGCKFPIVDEQLNHVEFDARLENIPLTCERTWDLISDGNTKGVFQLESRLGQTLAKKLRPRSIEHLAALISIMRPGCLEAIRDGKSVTDHYIDRKNGLELVDIFHPSLQPALGPTYGEMIYQEQAMRIAQDVAGFNLQQADVLRKAIGKKKPEIMAKVKKEFMEGVEKTGIMPLDQAELVFGWIEKSQRYSFNKSHAVSYAINGYLTAYAKAHFPRSFFTSYLYFAKEKTKPQEEISELANNAKMMDIEVYPPDFRFMNKHFRLINKNIYFGFADIKNVGESVITRLEKRATDVETKLGKTRKDWSWLEILVHLTPYVNSGAVASIISAGGFSYTGVPRTVMLFEYQTYSELSQREQHWAEENLAGKKNLTDLFEAIVSGPTGKAGACANKKRLEKIEGYLATLKNPPASLADTPEWIAMVEERVLGLPITCTVVDGCKTDAANCTVKDFVKGYNGVNGVILLACKIDDVKEIKTKQGKSPGQRMAFFTVSDGSGSYDGAVVFPKQWKDLKSLLTVGNTVLLTGKRSKEKDGLVVDKAWQI